MNRPCTALRHEEAADFAAVRALIHATFGRAEEADLVDALRSADALTISAVAEDADRVVAHIGFSPITIGGQHHALALAPVAVAPDFQRQGIGSVLIRWSLDECRRLGHGVVSVLGEPSYYSRFGFLPAVAFGIECPFPVPSEAYMVLELLPGSATEFRGGVSYRAEFEKF